MCWTLISVKEVRDVKFVLTSVHGNNMNIIEQNKIIDSILNTYKDYLGKEFDQYRNHVYRVYNFAILCEPIKCDIKVLSIASAFHDLGMWTNQTFDYLGPSIDLAKKYCIQNSIDNETISEIEMIIDNHHKMSKVKTSQLAEVFRRADLVDLSLGLFRNGIGKRNIQEIKKIFPNKGFHLNLCRLFLKNLLIHPLRPLPMYKL